MTATLRFTGTVWTVARWRSVGSLDNDAHLAVIDARRARTRMSGLHPEAVQLVAVADVDTAHLARRGRWTCTCNRPRNAEHALGCEWWRNDWTRAYPQHPDACQHPNKRQLRLTWDCPDCGRAWPRT